MDNVDNSVEILKSNVSFDEKMMKYLKPILGKLKNEEIVQKFYDLQDKAKYSKAPDFLAFWGYLYFYIKNYKEAIKWFRKSNDIYKASKIQCQIGSLYFEGGYGIEQDIPKAIEFFSGSVEEAKKNGKINVEASYKLGCIYRDGIGVDKNYELAAKYFESLIDKHSEAMYELGLLYYFGLGVSLNKHKAIELFEKSRNMGYIEAKIILNLIKE